MRKNFLIYQIIFSFFILSFSSCINQNFDLDDDKLDTNVTLGDSINLPIGDIEKISIYDELLKVCDALDFGDDSILYVEYVGAFPVNTNFSKFDVPTLSEGNPTEKTADISALSGLSGNIPVTEPYPLIKDEPVPFAINSPALIEGERITITPKKVGFRSFILQIKFKLIGLSFINTADDAQLTLSVKFSKHYTLKGADSENKVSRSVFLKDLNGNSEYPLGSIEVESYSFEEGEEAGLTYSVTLGGKTPIAFTANDPKFTFIPDPGEGELSVSYLGCSLKGEEEFRGYESGFSDLQNAFSGDDELKFKNPSLILDLTTNLGADFKLGLDLNAGNDKQPAFLENDLQFTKPEGDSKKTAHHELGPEQLKNFEEIISTPFPQELGYIIKLTFDDQNAILLPSEKLELSADYSFKIPFDFKNISLSLKDTITDLFNEDTYDQIFSHVDDVSIVADLDINIGNRGIELVVDAAILGSDKKKIPGLVTTSSNDNKLSIAIKGDDKEKMKKARHLELTFRLSGGGAIKESDYIKINKLRLVSSSGIHYEF